MGRRGENIRKRKDGRWEARMLTGYDNTRKAKYHSIYGKTYSEVKYKKELWMERNIAGKIANSPTYNSKLKITFEQICLEWLEAKRQTVKESSHARYMHIVKKHLLPELGTYYFSSITANMLNQFLLKKLQGNSELPESGLSPKTVSDIRAIIVQIVGYAEERRYPTAVTEKIFFPKICSPEIQILNKNEQQALETYAFQAQEPFSAGILLALYGGLRIGEICSLKWNDIQPESGIVRVDKTLLRIQNAEPDSSKTKLLIDKPKTSHSIRLIPLPGFVIEHLETLRKRSDCYVITGTDSFIEPRTCLDKYKKILKKIGLNNYSFHTLRHTFATRCIETGFDIKSLSEILGHANINITLQRYVHPSMELKRQQMERLEVFSIRGQISGQNHL